MQPGNTDTGRFGAERGIGRPFAAKLCRNHNRLAGLQRRVAEQSVKHPKYEQSGDGQEGGRTNQQPEHPDIFEEQVFLGREYQTRFIHEQSKFQNVGHHPVCRHADWRPIRIAPKNESQAEPDYNTEEKQHSK